MVLTDLRIELNTWGQSKGKYTGVAKFSDDTGEVSLKLNEDHVEKIFLVCSDAILEKAREAASYLVTAVIEQQKIIESKE